MIPHPPTDCSGSPSSCQLVQAAKARLRTNPYQSVQRIACECDERGTLFLRGRLTSFYQKQLAQEAVARLPGVSQVVNETVVVAST
ncbi:BON domain-containing protein [Planctomycetota bacterium]